MLKRVYIEITNICNLRCSFCLPTIRRPRIMNPEEFERILPSIRAITPYIYLHVKGEPLTHPDFSRLLALCDQYEMQVQLVTNGLLLSRFPDLGEHPSLRKVSFSLQSVEYHPPGDLSVYLENILAFAEESSKRGRPYCEIRFWRTDQTGMPATAECLRVLHERYTFAPADRRGSQQILKGVYVSSDNMFEWPTTAASIENDYGTCHGGIDQIAILSDGTVIPCCLDNDGEIPLGNIFRQPLEEILSSERYLLLCEGFRNHRITEELCRKCTFRHRFDRKATHTR